MPDQHAVHPLLPGHALACSTVQSTVLPCPPPCSKQDQILGEINTQCGTSYCLATPWHAVLAEPADTEEPDLAAAVAAAAPSPSGSMVGGWAAAVFPRQPQIVGAGRFYSSCPLPVRLMGGHAVPMGESCLTPPPLAAALRFPGWEALAHTA